MYLLRAQIILREPLCTSSLPVGSLPSAHSHSAVALDCETLYLPGKKMRIVYFECEEMSNLGSQIPFLTLNFSFSLVCVYSTIMGMIWTRSSQ